MSLVVLETTPSTQDWMADHLKAGTAPRAVLALEQSGGRGRFGRAWHSPRGESLSLTIALPQYAGHPRPWLLGFWISLHVAELTNLKLRWPNDLVFLCPVSNRICKVGGVLTELLPDQSGKHIPVIGVGLNLNQTEFPENIQGFAMSLHLIHNELYDPAEIARQLLDRLDDPPLRWLEIASRWMLRDATPGKLYRLPDGRTSTAITISEEGYLIADVEGELTTVLAADALFPSTPDSKESNLNP